MLFEKKTVAAGDIVSFKIVTGEEITGKLVTMTETGVSVARPICVALQMVGPQQAAIGFNPFMASIGDDQTLFFPIAMLVVSPTKTRQDVANQYIRATSSIEVPTAAIKAGLIL